MDDRFHRAPDHRRSRHHLTTAATAGDGEPNAIFDAVIRAVPARPLPPMGASVLRRIDAAGYAVTPLHLATTPRAKRGLGGWLWTSQQVSLAITPAHALAAAALVFAAALGVSRVNLRDAAPIVAAAPVAGPRAPVLVEFRLAAPDAQRVTLAGGFSDWQPEYTMTRATPGVWTVVVPLAPGVHEYAFVVDGQHWVPDPAAPSSPDGFGGVNSRVAVLPADRRT